MSKTRRLLDSALSRLNANDVLLGEVRHVDLAEEWLDVRGKEVDGLTSSTSRGVGVRVLANGAWGYAATSDPRPDAVANAADFALAMARENGDRTNPSAAPEVAPLTGRYETPRQRSYFDVSRAEKLDLLFAATEVLGADSRVVSASARTLGLRRRTHLVTTQGADIEQEIEICGGGIAVTAVENGEAQTRSLPKGTEGDINAAGWEFVEGMDLVGESERCREQAIALLSAPDCPTKRRALIVDGAQMSLQIHESCGHPIELDRALGEEISLAGCSFLRPEMLNDFTYGSEIVNLYADSTSPGGPGTFGWDDEGVPAHRWDIVREGKFVGYLGSRETSARVPKTVPGALRADSWRNLPIVRMVNINLEPGSWTLDDMIADTEDGLMVSVNKSWSIDDFRLNFQFGCEVGWEIENGEITRMVKNPVYTGITPTFWAGCDAIANEDHWRMWGWRFCGKGDPMQLIHVGHGCAPARFQNVETRSSK